LPTSLLDLGIKLDPDRRFPRLGKFEKEEWSKKILTRYLLNIGPLLLGFVIVSMSYVFNSATEVYFYAAIFALCVGMSFYFTRKYALEDRTLVWVSTMEQKD
jgi:hypothetical protein